MSWEDSNQSIICETSQPPNVYWGVLNQRLRKSITWESRADGIRFDPAYEWWRSLYTRNITASKRLAEGAEPKTSEVYHLGEPCRRYSFGPSF